MDEFWRWFIALDARVPAGLMGVGISLFTLWFTKHLDRKHAVELAGLRARADSISTLAGGALAQSSAHGVALSSRRLAAAEHLWTAVVALAPARGLSKMMTGIRFEESVRESKHNPSVRKMAEDVIALSGLRPVIDEMRNASLVRPFVSPNAWATFRAYSAICSLAIARWNAIRVGAGSDSLMDNEGVARLITAALPEFGAFIDANGPDSFDAVLQSLEDKLLKDLASMLSGTEDIAATLDRTAEVLRAAGAVETQIAVESQESRPERD